MLGRLLLAFAVAGLPALTSQAGPIGPGGINAGSTLLTFDANPNGTFLSNEFSHLGVVFGSGQTPTGLIGAMPASYVVTENEFPNATASAPNKIIGTLMYSDGGPQKCNPCAIVVTFLDPLPTQVAFWVSDPDLGQFAEFTGSAGLLGTLIVDSGSSAVPFFMGFQDSGGISEVVVHSIANYGVGIDNLQFGTPVPEPSTALLLALGLIGIAVASRTSWLAGVGFRCRASGSLPAIVIISLIPSSADAEELLSFISGGGKAGADSLSVILYYGSSIFPDNNAPVLFEDFVFTPADSPGIIIQLTESDDPDFPMFEALMTNGEPDPFRITTLYSDGGAAGVRDYPEGECHSFALLGSPCPGNQPIDLAGYDITSIELTLDEVYVTTFSGGRDGVYGQVTFTVYGTAVPEPSTGLLLATGILGLGLRRTVARRSQRLAIDTALTRHPIPPTWAGCRRGPGPTREAARQQLERLGARLRGSVTRSSGEIGDRDGS